MNCLHWMKKEKECRGCSAVKPAEDFGPSKRGAYGLRSRCRACERAANLAWQRKNRDHVNAKQREYYRTPKGRAIKEVNNARRKPKQAIYNATAHAKTLNRLRKREEYRRRRGVLLARVKTYYAENRDKRREYMSQPQMRLHSNVSRAIRAALKLNKAGRRWESLVGYSRADLVAHLERQFVDGMSWENYGKWEIDHIRPRVSFAFMAAEDPQFRECWALANLQPLWMRDNRSKHARLVA
jgi:hypothetical protein